MDEQAEFLVTTHEHFTCRAVICADGKFHFSGGADWVDPEPIEEDILAVVRVPTECARDE